MTGTIRRGAVAGAAAVLLALAAAAPAAAQIGSFGQNKIQYRGFEWRVLKGAHVDLYFYPDAEELARVALAYAEESYDVLERRFAHAVARRIPFIIYASHTDFEQTNVLPFVPPEGLLGVTEFLKRRVALPFRGNYAEFRHTIRHELVHVFQLSLAEELSIRYPRQRYAGLPLWWSEGLAEFYSSGEDTRDEMVLRDLTLSGRLPALADLTYAYGGIVYPLGGAIHRFLAERYGEWRIGAMYRDRWKYQDFDGAVAAIYGRTPAQLSEEWQYWMRQRYYPVVTDATPLALTASTVAELAIKPVAWHAPGDSATEVLYFSPGRGYAEIHGSPIGRGRSRTVVQGERDEQFESFHFFASRLDVSPGGVIAFSSRYLDRDALFLWSLERRDVVGRYQFDGLVSILSPAWAPDGRSVVFSGLSVTGYSDLYRVWFPEGRLERLTHDRYEDLDPTFSPDGRTVVFASDRTPFGRDGARNLFRLDLVSGAVDYVTYGPWTDETPRWSPHDGRVYFASDRSGTFQLYAVDSTGTGRQLTRTLNGAFDPQFVEPDGGLVFGGFADLRFNIYFSRPAEDSTLPPVALAADRAPMGWTWSELEQAEYARADATPYTRRFSLDFAAGDVLVAPGIGSAQGAVFLFSDLLSDHVVYAGISSYQGNDLGEVLENLNGVVFYLNQSRRINWGVGAFRTRGVFYDLDLASRFFESAVGAFAQVRYPLSRFQRLEGEYRIEQSERRDFFDPGGTTEIQREAWLASNYLSYVKDNTLWLMTGPIDGARFVLTGGLSNDITHGRFDSWVLRVDARRYLRTSLRSAIAVRAIGYYAGGDRPRRINLGGTWYLRGYPRQAYVVGSRAWLLNAEWRFPLTDFIAIGFPFGTARFPGLQGAMFTDLGRVWTAQTDVRGALGSLGFGLRLPIAAPLILRLDMGWRFFTGDPRDYGLPPSARDARFVDFFFGFNY
jgi:hypothetical protein